MATRKELKSRLLKRADEQDRSHEVVHKLFEIRKRVDKFVQDNKQVEEEIQIEQDEPRSVKMINTLNRYAGNSKRYTAHTEE